MDARAYFDFTDAIAAASSRGELDDIKDRLETADMHPIERRVLERALRTRGDTLRLSEIVVQRPKPERAD